MIAHLIVLAMLVSTVPVLELQARNALVDDRERLAIASRDRWLGALERIGGVALVLAGFVYLSPVAFVPRVLLQREDWRDSTLRSYMFVQTAVSFCSAILCGLVLVRIPAPVL